MTKGGRGEASRGCLAGLRAGLRPPEAKESRI